MALCRFKIDYMGNPSNSNLSDKKYCCLGIAVIVSGGENVFVKSSELSDKFGILRWGTRTYAATWNASLPPEMRESINLTFSEQSDLTTLNDTKLFTFDQIADYIEANL